MNVKENFTRVGKFIAFTLLLLLAGVSSWAQGRVTGKVIDGIDDYLNRHGYSSINDIIGAMEV